MKGWIEALPWYQRHKAVFIYIAIIGIVGSILYSVVWAAILNAQATIKDSNDKYGKENCLGTYNTVICHQYKIEQIQLDEKYRETVNAQSTRVTKD